MEDRILTPAQGNRTNAMHAFMERALAQRGGTPNAPQMPPQAPQMPQGNPSVVPGTSPSLVNQPMAGGAAKQLPDSQPDEAQIIVKALINRLRDLTPKQDVSNQ